MSSEPTDPRVKHTDQFAPEVQEQPGLTAPWTQPDHGEESYEAAGPAGGKPR